MNDHYDIAIVGIGLRFPGGAKCTDSFWENLVNRVDAISEVKKARWNPATHYCPGSEKRRSKSKTKWGGFVDDLIGFDAAFFGITPREADTLDPQQRVLLEVCWNAFEDAGLRKQELSQSRTGVYIGGFTLDYMVQQLSGTDLNKIEPHTATGSMMTLLSNRLSYVFGLTGPSLSVDTACSSSLVATHLACTSLLSRESDIALAGGVNALLIPSYFVAESQAGMLSPTGRSRTFDSRADGYVRGEGAGIVVLKRLEDAVTADDRIYAVIKATGVNQDGQSKGLTVPSGDAQMRLMEEVYSKAEISPKNVVFVEAHGTGTPVGDPIEANAVGRFMRQEREVGKECYIGSVKTNIGHTEAAAGVAGLIKAALSIYKKQLPPHLHLREVNPDIDLEVLKLKIPTDCVDLELASKEIIAGVNSFGFGGTNAHAVLQGYIGNDHKPNENSNQALTDRACVLIPVSARSVTSLRQLAADYGEKLVITNDSEHLNQLLTGICHYRDHHHVRSVVVAKDIHDVVEQLSGLANGEPLGDTVPNDLANLRIVNTPREKLAWVFTGMGPQWWAMGQQLYKQESVFKAALDWVCAEFDKYTTPAGWSLAEEMFKSEHDSFMNETRVAQAANFALQVSLAELWNSWGIRPDLVVGHSAGEPAAAYMAGALSFEDAVLVSYHRSRLQQLTAGKGRMIAIDVTVEKARELMASVSKDELSIAAINARESLTIAGSNRAIDRLAAKLEDSEVFSKVLHVDIPYHSHVMEELQDELVRKLSSTRPGGTHTPLYSTVTGDLIEGECLNANYWYQNIRQPVYFYKVIQRMVDAGFCGFMEIGPHPVLTNSIRQTLAEINLDGETSNTSFVLHSLNRKLPEQKSVLMNLSALYCAGFEVNWGQVYNEQLATNFVAYPKYPWDHQHFWSEPPSITEFRVHRNPHPFLAHRVASATPTWDIDTFSGALDYIKDHQIQGSVVFPASGYIEMFLAATRELYGESVRFELINIQLLKAIYLVSDVKIDIQLSFAKGNGQYTLATRAYDSNASKWEVNSQAKVVIRHSDRPQADSPATIAARCPIVIAAKTVYSRFKDFGLEYGPLFQGISSMRQGQGEVLITLGLEESTQQECNDYQVHPVLGDLCLQALAASLPIQTNRTNTVFLPVSVGKVVKYGSVLNAKFIHSKIIEQNAQSITCDIKLLDADGRVLLALDHSRAKAIGVEGEFVGRKAQKAYTIKWQAQDLPMEMGHPTSTSVHDRVRRWIVFGDGNALEQQLVEQLKAHHQECELVRLADVSRTNGNHYTIDAKDSKSYETLLDDIQRTNETPIDGIIYLWGCALTEHGFTGDVDVTDIGRVSHYLLYLLQATIKLDWRNKNPKIWVVSDQAQSITNVAPVKHCLQGPLWGMGRVAGQVEHKDLWGGIVDIDAQSRADINSLVYELLHDSQEDQVAFRQGQRYVPRLTTFDDISPANRPVFRPDITYLITGGLGALGLITARWLVENGARHLLLLSRSGLPPRKQWRSLSSEHHAHDKVQAVIKLEKLGCHVIAGSVDVSDYRQLTKFIKRYEGESRPPINAVYHTAGVAVPELIVDMDRTNFERVFPAKIQGTINLHKMFSDRALDAFVLYSSLASVVTSSGQTSYSAANAFLDAFAHWRNENGQSALSINWGPWGEAGMAADLDLIDFFASRGFFAMSNHQATEMLGALTIAGCPQAVVVSADWHNAVKVGYPMGMGPAYLNELRSEPAENTNTDAEESTNDNINFLLNYVNLDSIAKKKELLIEQLIQIGAQLLRIDTSVFTPKNSFTSIGLDSMLAMELRTRLASTFGVNIAVVDLLNNRPIQVLADKLYLDIEQHLSELETEWDDGMVA